jgi:hypothetical protein
VRKTFTPEIKEQYNELMTTKGYSKPAAFKMEEEMSNTSSILGGFLMLTLLAIMILFSKLGETNKQVSELKLISGAFGD